MPPAATPLPHPPAVTIVSNPDAGVDSAAKQVLGGNLSSSEITTIVQAYKLTDVDKEFIPADTSASPCTDHTITILQAILNGLSVLAFLGGSGGIPVAALLTFTSSALSAVPVSNGNAANNLTAIKTIVADQLADQTLRSHLDAVGSYSRFLQENRQLLSALELDTTGKEPVFAHQTTFRNNLDILNNILIPTIRKQTLPGSDSLYDRLKGLGKEGVNPPWNRPDIRAAGILINTMLFISYKYLALFEARYSAYFLSIGQSENADMHLTTYFYEIDQLRSELNDALGLLRGNIDRLRKERQEKVQAVKQKEDTQVLTPSDPSAGPSQPNYAWSYWIDDYNGAGEHKHDAKKEFGIFVSSWDYSSSDTAAKAERDAYITRLNAHIDRVLHPDETIHVVWNHTLASAQSFLTPIAPVVTVVEEQLKTVEHPNEWLHDAQAVEYCYEVQNSFGTSPKSPWTKKFPFDQHQLPVLHLEARVSREVTYQVYHRKTLADGTSPEALAAKVPGGTDNKLIKWVDEHVDAPGGR